jgi:hypothetical protein
MLHHPLIADGAEPFGRFPAEQQNAADHESDGPETDPHCRAQVHALIIRKRTVDCKHSRIGWAETSSIRYCES